MLKSGRFLHKMRNITHIRTCRAFFRALDIAGTVCKGGVLAQNAYSIRHEQEKNFKSATSRFHVERDVLAEHIAFVTECLDSFGGGFEVTGLEENAFGARTGERLHHFGIDCVVHAQVQVERPAAFGVIALREEFRDEIGVQMAAVESHVLRGEVTDVQLGRLHGGFAAVKRFDLLKERGERCRNVRWARAEFEETVFTVRVDGVLDAHGEV